MLLGELLSPRLFLSKKAGNDEIATKFRKLTKKVFLFLKSYVKLSKMTIFRKFCLL